MKISDQEGLERMWVRNHARDGRREGYTVVRRIYQLVVILLALSLGGSAHAIECVPGEVLVQLAPGANIDQFNQTFGTQTLAKSSYLPCYRLALPAGADVNACVSQWSTLNGVVSVSPNLCSHDQGGPFKPATLQWISDANGNGGAIAYAGQSSISLVNYGHIAKRFTGEGVMVAILDTGISKRNPKLANQVAQGYNFVDNNEDADDRPSNIDSNGDGVMDGAVGHGTMVAGLIYRFAPRARLLPVKVLNSDGEGTLWATLEGIYYAVSRGARILNLSFGSAQPSDLLQQAIEEAHDQGVLVVTSAGNNNSSDPQYPAHYKLAIDVASLNDDGTKAGFSNYGRDVDLDAPGVAIVSMYWDGRYAAWSGTSFSAPIVSAEAALILSARPEMHVKKLRFRLLDASHSVDWLNPDYDDMLGKDGQGLIDMDLALSGL